MTSANTVNLDAKERHKRAVRNARFVYLAIALSFLSICTVAVTSMMAMEKNKTTFKAIKVAKPISFFDHTYMDDSQQAATKAAEPAPAAQPDSKSN
jgi:hypothetical protein